MKNAGDGFGLVRIAAATLVILSHAFPLLGLPEPGVHAAGMELSLGSVAVRVFFVVSGYLITSSWARDPRPRGYLLRRFARIWPGLLVMLLLTTFLVGPLVSTIPVGRYLRSPVTFEYLASNLLLLVRLVGPPGTFAHNHIPDAMNQSLWTLPIEVAAYLLLLGVGAFVNTARRGMPTVLLTAGVIAVAAAAVHVLAGDAAIEVLWRLLREPLLAYFAAGSVLYLLRSHLRYGILGLLTAAAAIALMALSGHVELVFVPFAYIVIYFCTRRGLLARQVEALGDPSYGMYIYAFPVQQVLVFAGVAKSPAALFAEATLLTAVIGYTSWHLVEHRALKWARYASRVDRKPRVGGSITAGSAPPGTTGGLGRS